MLYSTKRFKSIFTLFFISFATVIFAANDDSAQVKSSSDLVKRNEQIAINEKLISDYSLSEEQIIHLSSIINRINLTNNQIEQFLPIFLDTNQRRQDVLKKNKIDLNSLSSGKKIGIVQLRSFKIDMDKINKQSMNKFEKILNENQLDKYKKIQQEQRIELRDRLRNRK